MLCGECGDPRLFQEADGGSKCQRKGTAVLVVNLFGLVWFGSIDILRESRALIMCWVLEAPFEGCVY